jgi:hypothetical protein
MDQVLLSGVAQNARLLDAALLPLLRTALGSPLGQQVAGLRRLGNRLVLIVPDAAWRKEMESHLGEIAAQVKKIPQLAACLIQLRDT